MDVSSSPARAAEATEHGTGTGTAGLVNAVDAMPCCTVHAVFMLHVLLLLLISWLFLPVNLTGLFLLCVLIVYLFQVERWAREIEQRRIASAERRKINTRRTFDEGETSRWLNEGIKSMWPLGMEMFASKHFFGPMAPYFLDKYKPSWIVKEAKMDIISLGSTPPVLLLLGRVIISQPTEDKCWFQAYEANMEFHSGDDMNAELRVLNTTFYISRLHIEGKVKISVEFLNGWPVVGRVRLCFASIPQVTMSYKLYYLPDMSLFRGVDNLVKNMLHKAMEDSIVQPNFLEVDIEAIAASLLFPDSRPQQGATENKSTLLVEILEATSLKVADRNGRSDPFVNIYFGGGKKKTKVIRRNLHPKWTDEKHEFPIKNWDLSNLLVLHVQDWDRVRHRPTPDLGMLTVDLKNLYYQDGKKYEFGKRYEFLRDLEGVSTGQLRFAITVNHGSSNFEEPGTSDAGFETVTQEIKSDYVVYNAPSRAGATTEMKRSKSDTNLNKLRSTPAAARKLKGKAKRSTPDPIGNNDKNNTTATTTNKTGNKSMGALKDQMVFDETYEIIDMPYGPRGAFTIYRPGSLVQRGGPSSREDTGNGQMTSKSAATAGILDKVDGAAVGAAAVYEGQAAEALGKAQLPSWLRVPFRVRGKRRTSRESNVLTETMSEQSESLENIDMLISTDELTRLGLDQLSHQYHGPVRMDRIDTPVDVAPDEPPDMYTPTTSLPPPIHSYNGKIASSSHVHAEVVDHSTSTVIHASPEPQHHVPRNNINGTAFSGYGPTAPRPADDDDDGESVPEDYVLHAPSSPPRPPQRQSTGKLMPPWLPKKWYQKIRSLAAKSGKKKTMKTTPMPTHGAAAAVVNSNGMAYSSELNAEDGDHADQGSLRHQHPAEESQDWDHVTTSSTQSFTIGHSSPLDVNNTSNYYKQEPINNGSTPGDYSPADELHLQHEQRNLMQETPQSRSAGSQSDRSNWASKMKKLIRYQSTSKSLRFEKLKPPLPPRVQHSASLNGTAERSTGPVNTGNSTSVPALPS